MSKSVKQVLAEALDAAIVVAVVKSMMFKDGTALKTGDTIPNLDIILPDQLPGAWVYNWAEVQQRHINRALQIIREADEEDES